MTSLKILAEKLNLSTTQVSRALDDKPDVSAATKAKVRAAAITMNYRPNSAARSLRKRKADTIAVVLPANANHFGLTALLNMVFETADALAHHGFDLIMVPGPADDNEIETLQRLVDGRRADAMIVLRMRRQDERVAFLAGRGIPFVTHGRTDGTIEHAFVDGDGEAGFAAATRLLIDLGHVDIALIGAEQRFNFAHLRRAGWLSAMRERGIDPCGLEIAAAPNEEAGREAAIRMLDRRPPPTALLCATDAMAIGAIGAVRAAGLVPGRDVSIIGHDGVQAGLLTTPPLSTMQIAATDVGARLADKLIRCLGGARPGDLQEILPINQVPRATHGPPLR